MRNTILLILLMGLLNVPSGIAETGFGASEPGSLMSRPPASPILVSPADAAIVLSDTITVVWGQTFHTLAYSLQTSLSPDFTTLLIDETAVEDTLFSFATTANDTIYWRVSSFNIAGESSYSEIWHISTIEPVYIRDAIGLNPDHFELFPPFPNPFNPTTLIQYQLAQEVPVSLMIYNNLGQEVSRLAAGNQQAGRYGVTWDGNNRWGKPLASGVYICHLVAGDRTFTQKILLIR